jgi:hypothetical protein
MGKTYQQLTAALGPKRRKRVAARVVKMIAEERARRDRRLVRLVTQYTVKRSSVRQRNISQLAKRTDMVLSTLHDHVRKLGGELVITVQFPGREPVRVIGFTDITSAAGTSRSLGQATSARERTARRTQVSTGKRKSPRKPGSRSR